MRWSSDLHYRLRSQTDRDGRGLMTGAPTQVGHYTAELRGLINSHHSNPPRPRT
jgi:hypothetical protein